MAEGLIAIAILASIDAKRERELLLRDPVRVCRVAGLAFDEGLPEAARSSHRQNGATRATLGNPQVNDPSGL